MPKHTLAHAMVGILVMPGLIFAGYPDVPRSHWASPAVDKVAQSGVMTSRSDGRFHGGNPATRYEVASAIARAMAEMENRLVAEGHAPQDIVPYIERINLYVADEIDHLKQAQKELRATVNELLERIERREAHSTPLPPPAPPMSHPHMSPTPASETQQHTEVRTEQRIHAVEGAAAVNQRPNAPQHKAALARVRTRVSDGKIGAVEGAATVTPAKSVVSDEAAWDKSPSSITEPADEPQAPLKPAKPVKSTSSAAISQLEKDEKKVEDETVVADESQPDIGWTDVDAARPAAPKAPAKPAKVAAPKKAATTAAVAPAKVPKAAKPLVTSQKPAPKAAPIALKIGPAIESSHGAVSVGNAFTNEYDASPIAVNEEAKATAKPVTTASIATSVPMEAAEILDTPDIAQADGPTDEQLSNWSGSKAAASAAAAPVKLAAAPAAAPKQVFQRSAKANSLLEQLRSRKPAGK